MSYTIRSIICNKIVQTLEGISIGGKGLKPIQFVPAVKLCPKTGPHLEYNVQITQKKNLAWIGTLIDPQEFIAKFPTDETVTAAYLHHNDKSKVKLKVCQKKCFKEVLNNACEKPSSFWKSSSLLSPLGGKNVLVEFSSPNIAKLFHVGNLRSTIIGNFITRINEAVGNKVVRINYLGDWGTQFGLLKYGYDAKEMKPSDLSENAIKKLYDLYVWVNQEAKKSPEISEKAKVLFNQMEKGDQSILQTWNLFRDLSIEEFKKSYKRLNIIFDEYHGESMYSLSKCDDVLRSMESKNILQTWPDGHKSYKMSENQPAVTIVKTDGSTLYITRDIAAAIDRFQKYNFDKMIYVVDSGQIDHFKVLFSILKDLGYDWSSKLEHVRFGRILGMSTRKGQAVFFNDVLDEASSLALGKQTQAKHISKDSDFDSIATADIMGMSGIILANLKRLRLRDFSFKWDDVLMNGGGNGPYFQYAHCRMVRLEENCGVEFTKDVNEELLVEPEALNLLRSIARFDEAIHLSFVSLESTHLVVYLFNLVSDVNNGYRKLTIKNTPNEIAVARLKLFRAARHTLHSGMSILGLTPLSKM